MEKFYINAQSAVKNGDYLIFWSLNANSLISYNTVTNEIQALDIERRSPDWPECFLFNECVNIGDVVYFAPYSSAYICSYDIKKSDIEYIPLGGKGKFSDIFIFNESMYLWGWGKNNVYEFDIQSREKTLIKEIEDVFISSNPVLVNERAFFTTDKKSIVCEYNFISREYNEHKIDGGEVAFNTICYKDECLYLSGDDNRIIKWNIENSETNSFVIRNLNIKPEFWNNFLFNCCKIWGAYIYYSPYKANSLMRFDTINNEIEVVTDFEDATGGNFIEISTETLCFIEEIEDHQAGCDILIEKDGKTCKEDMFWVSYESMISVNAPMSMKESKANSLSRFISAVKA